MLRKFLPLPNSPCKKTMRFFEGLASPTTAEYTSSSDVLLTAPRYPAHRAQRRETGLRVRSSCLNGSVTSSGETIVHGGDEHARCKHYGLPVDVVAMKYACCESYYACHLCHAELADHPAQRWPATRFDDPATLCGICGSTMTVTSYLVADECPSCHAPFNPGCRNHRSIYFDVSDSTETAAQD